MRFAPAVSLAVILVITASRNVAGIPLSYFANRTTSCVVSNKPPTEPMPLEFCHWYNENSCCLPGADLQASDAFFSVVSLGSGCAPMNQYVRAAYREVREILCMPCDPKEPTYRVKAKDGDGSQVAADPTAADDAYVWRVCWSFMYGSTGQGGFWGGDGSKYDRCGAKVTNDCNSRKQVFYNTTSGKMVTSEVSTQPDGASCGNSYVFPSVDYVNATEDLVTRQFTAGEKFMKALPHWMSGWNYVIVNDLDPTFNFTATPCFGIRGADGVIKTGSASAFSIVSVIIAVVVSSMAL